MATRQLTLKRTVYDSKEIIKRNFPEFLDGILTSMFYDSLPVFKEALYNNFMYFAKVVPSDEGFGMFLNSNLDVHNSVTYLRAKVAPSDIGFEMFYVSCISSIVKYSKGSRDFMCNDYTYTFLTKEVLPEMWRSRKEIELKRQRKLEDLANLLDNVGRYQEAHVIRIIVKPHLERMNRKWTNMTALEKFKSLFS